MAKSRSGHVIPLPKFVLVIRGFQLLLAVIILGVSAYGIYWVAFDAWCFALFTALATMIICVYAILANHVTSCAKAYNYWALLALEIFGVIFWLSSMAALAATRAGFIYPTEISECVNYGYGGICYKRDIIEKRAVATYGYLNMMSGAAGLSALEMILFVATLTIFSIRLRRARSSNPRLAPTSDKLEAHPMNPVQAYGQPQPYSSSAQYYSAPDYSAAPANQQPYDPPPQTYGQPSYNAPQQQHYQGLEVNQGRN